MKRVFFHIHIWKTGGTSFLKICSENFGYEFHRDKMLIQNWSLSNQQLRWLLTYHDWLRCYSCHMLSGDLPYDHENKEVIGIAFVRNPVNRFISSYNMQRGEGYKGGIAKLHNFDEFCEKAIANTFDPMWRNGQTFILGGSGTQAGLDIISQRVEKGRLILLPTERFDESCVLLERQFPDDFKNCSYTRYNASKSRESVSEQQRAVIARYMEIDFKLLALANEFLDSTLKRVFSDIHERQQYMKIFQRRCSLKEQRKRLTYHAKNIRTTLTTALNKAISAFEAK